MKRFTAEVAILAAGLWFIAIPAAAQGRGMGGRPGGAPGMSGSHMPMGMPGSENMGSMRPDNPHTSSPNSTPKGPKSPATLLEQNIHLKNNLASFFPAGTNLTMQATGFKNLGQFVAAVHVSHNLDIPFDQLKCTELGTKKATASGMTCPSTVTNESGMSLGKAIHTIQPDTNSKQAVHDANRQAKTDIQSSKS
jgi:hypothetical protein